MLHQHLRLLEDVGVGAVSSVSWCDLVCRVAVSARCTVDGTEYFADVQLALFFTRVLLLTTDSVKLGYSVRRTQ